MANKLPNEPVAFICMRDGDPGRRIASSKKIKCRRCESLVWITPATLARVRAFDHVYCMQCAAAIAEERNAKFTVAPPTPQQLAEIAEAISK